MKVQRYTLKLAYIRMPFFENHVGYFQHIWDNVLNTYVDVDAIALGIPHDERFTKELMIAISKYPPTGEDSFSIFQHDQTVMALCRWFNHEDALYMSEVFSL